MKTVRFASLIAMLALILLTGLAQAQDLGANIRKIADGVYVYVGNNLNSNCGIVIRDRGPAYRGAAVMVWSRAVSTVLVRQASPALRAGYGL